MADRTPTDLDELASSIGLGRRSRARKPPKTFQTKPPEPGPSRAARKLTIRQRRALALAILGVVINFARLGLELRTEHESVAPGPTPEEIAQDARDEAELQAALRDEERDYGAANIRAEKRRLARSLEPGDRVVQVVVGGDGVLGVMLLGEPRSRFFFTRAPAEVGFFRTTRQFALSRAIRVSDIDPEAPLRLVQSAERLSPDGTSMNIDRVLLRESPEHDGKLIWTLIPDDPDVPVTYYADRSARHVVTDRTKL